MFGVIAKMDYFLLFFFFFGGGGGHFYAFYDQGTNMGIHLFGVAKI